MAGALTKFEWIAFQMIERAVELEHPAPTNLDIEMELGCASSSIPPLVVQSLEAKGIITVTRYQRAREITIVASGKSTAPHPQRQTSRHHVPRGAGSAAGKPAKASRRMT